MDCNGPSKITSFRFLDFLLSLNKSKSLPKIYRKINKNRFFNKFYLFMENYLRCHNIQIIDVFHINHKLKKTILKLKKGEKVKNSKTKCLNFFTKYWIYRMSRNFIRYKLLYRVIPPTAYASAWAVLYKLDNGLVELYTVFSLKFQFCFLIETRQI